MMNGITQVIIISPGFEQRVSKIAYSFLSRGIEVAVIAQDRVVSDEFKNYVAKVTYIELPKQRGRASSLPFGKKRSRFIANYLTNYVSGEGRTLVIARDITYGAIVGRIIRSKGIKCRFTIDIADNFDLFYDAVNNPFVRIIFRLGYYLVQREALSYADNLLVVSPNNVARLREKYHKQIARKVVCLLRNLPIDRYVISKREKLQNTMVYVGRIDEISRDLCAPLAALTSLKQWTLHLYSSEKKDTIQKLHEYASQNGISERLVIHERVPYKDLLQEVSQYTLGIVPHKRNKLTDYTIPNKIYDYRNAGLVTLLSDNPSLVEENDRFGFGVVYHDNIIEGIIQASQYVIDDTIVLPTWEQEFDEYYKIMGVKDKDE